MTHDSIKPWVARYRASAGDIPSPDIDRVILAAAGREAVRRRGRRQMRAASLAAVIGLLAIGTGWQIRSHSYRPSPGVTDYGRLEGASRHYLLDVASYQNIGFGRTEGVP